MPFGEEIKNLPFFWGRLSQKESEETLLTKPIGSFLLRLEENGFIALSVRSDDVWNIVQDYVPYGMNKSEKDTKETIINAFKEKTPAKFPVLRKMPSLFELSNQEIFKNLDTEEDLEQLGIPSRIIALMKEAKVKFPVLRKMPSLFELSNQEILKYLDSEEEMEQLGLPSRIIALMKKERNNEDYVEIPNFKGFEGQNTELDDFMPPLIS